MVERFFQIGATSNLGNRRAKTARVKQQIKSIRRGDRRRYFIFDSIYSGNFTITEVKLSGCLDTK